MNHKHLTPENRLARKLSDETFFKLFGPEYYVALATLHLGESEEHLNAIGFELALTKALITSGAIEFLVWWDTYKALLFRYNIHNDDFLVTNCTLLYPFVQPGFRIQMKLQETTGPVDCCEIHSLLMLYSGKKINKPLLNE